MNDELTTRLSRQLHDQVDGWHDAPLTLEGVQGRARTIRRRRQALASGVVAASVLALAVPFGIGLASRTDSTPDVTSPSPTRVVDQAPTPRADGTFPLAPLAAPTDTAPESGYIRLSDDTLVTPPGEQPLPTGTVQLEHLGDGWIGLRSGNFPQSFGTQLIRLDEALSVTDEVPAASLVVDAAGTHAAWVEVDAGTWSIVQATPDGETARTEVGEQTQLVGHLTDGSVVFTTPDFENGDDVHAVVSPDGRVAEFDGGLRPLAASEATSQVAVLTKYGVESCYAVLDPTTSTHTFDTCDFEPRAFSPDGSLVVGLTAGADGVGSPQLAVLDSATGEPLVEWTADRGDRSPASVQQVVWEDDDTLLATVTEGNQQTVVSARLDGSLRQLADPAKVQMSIAYRFPGAVWNLD